MRVEVYIWPQEHPMENLPEEDIRINYNNQWIDFRDGNVLITPEIKQLNTTKPFGGLDCGG